ncbi:MAG TPA: hypothetical protein IGS53_04485 [Leptolyngbyaceae cyanobacterium M33_DOE_097]|uniref:DUF5666 domain-containing protein n=1 Tax=Oscillatoriales cyanobacterium SpSt-418 TaxID=2282169 RepID=A0A7C3KIS1_9CYAN|nr:hypothetical protein [Leptolyngbyaceae cyanobacterium M33_DOE_097]
MFKYFATAALVTLAIAPMTIAQTTPTETETPTTVQTEAQTTAPMEVVGQIESIDPQTETMVVKTSDGATRTVRYLPGSVDASKLQPGDTVVLGYKKAVPGTVVNKVRNFVYVRPDYSSDAPDRIVVIPQPVNEFRVGDRVVLLSKDRLERISDDTMYLSNGDVIEYVRYEIPTVAAAERSTVTIESLPRRQSETVEQPAVVEQPVVEETAPVERNVSQPVRALW